MAGYAENEPIIEELRRMGVDFAPGCGVCKPTPLFEPSPKEQAGAPALALPLAL